MTIPFLPWQSLAAAEICISILLYFADYGKAFERRYSGFGSDSDQRSTVK
jgi:hypothetical protein